MNNIIKILEEVLETPVNKNTNTENCEEWDSMNHVNIILELQDCYNIKISSRDIDQLKSVEKITNYLKLNKVIK